MSVCAVRVLDIHTTYMYKLLQGFINSTARFLAQLLGQIEVDRSVERPAVALTGYSNNNKNNSNS